MRTMIITIISVLTGFFLLTVVGCNDASPTYYAPEKPVPIPKLISPENGSVGVEIIPIYICDAEKSYVQVQISTEPSFNTMIISNYVYTDSVGSFSFPTIPLNYGNIYYWQVQVGEWRMHNGHWNVVFGDWSEISSFTTKQP